MVDTSQYGGAVDHQRNSNKSSVALYIMSNAIA